jgi:hypothetical protein
MGFTIDREDPGYPTAPGLTLGFTREAGHDVPLDTDEEPLYFQSILVGPENYYDSLLERR